jgi:hypothetical protein
MKTGFSDPIKIKGTKKVKNPWSFECPPYDERSSCFVNAGTHYGVGHKQPVGRHGDPKETVASLPTNRKDVQTLQDDKVYKGKVGLIEHGINE